MVWLDPEMTSPYRMYQYWINTDDRDVIKFLRLFTFLEISQIGEMEESLRQSPEKRDPHRRLAFEFTQLAHGTKAAQAAQEASEILFGWEVQSISEEGFETLAAEVPSTAIPKDRLQKGIPLVEILVEIRLAKSKRAARDLIGQGGAYVNNMPWRDDAAKVSLDQALSGRAVLLRSGKKAYHLLIVG